MNILRMLGLAILVTMSVCASAETRTSAPVAIIYSLAGKASLSISAADRRPLRLFDRLAVGTTLEVGSGSRLVLAFANGRRYELAEHSRATLGSKDLASRTGPVRSLPTFPPLPRISPIAAEDRPGPRAGAVRIRSERIERLYPDHGVATLARATTLRFGLVEGAGKFRVEVQDRQGDVVFATETGTSVVNLPSRVLKPGTRYRWMVRTVERVGPVVTGNADFVTLPRRTAEAREALRRAVETTGDGASLVLLAEVDRNLGLLVEACDELRTAVRASPEDAELGAALAELERRLLYLQSP